jgi:hypothetical protein
VVVTAPRTSTRDEADPSASALVRLPVHGVLWAESLPPAPGGRRVTVSFSPPGLAAAHRETLDLLGYDVVEGADDEGPDVAWLVVPAEAALAHARWWASVRDLADAVFPLAMGPVAQRYAHVLRAHLRGPAG